MRLGIPVSETAILRRIQLLDLGGRQPVSSKLVLPLAICTGENWHASTHTESSENFADTRQLLVLQISRYILRYWGEC